MSSQRCVKPLRQAHLSISRSSPCALHCLPTSSSFLSQILFSSGHALCSQRLRPFTSSPQCGNQSKVMQREMRASSRGVKPTQQGVKSRLRTMPASELPTDLGLLPNLFIRPRNRSFLPGWFQRPINRLKFEIFCLRDKIRDPFLVYWQFRRLRRGASRLNPEFFSRIPVALTLHKLMYEALANGEAQNLSRICCDGLAGNIRLILQRRELHEKKQTWELIKYNGLMPLPTPMKAPPEMGVAAMTFPERWTTPNRWVKWLLPLPLKWAWNGFLPVCATIVSDRAVPVPNVGRDFVLRQVVVRIHSKQRLREGEGAAKVQDLIEHVVLQRLHVEGTWQPWQIWGTTRESTKEEVDEFLLRGFSGTNVPGKKRMGMFSQIAEKMKTMMPV